MAKKKTPTEEPVELTTDERIARLELAYTVHTGHNLSEFDPPAVVAARKAAEAKAAEKEAAAAEKAADVAAEPLSDEQRLDRLEQAVIATTGISLT